MKKIIVLFLALAFSVGLSVSGVTAIADKYYTYKSDDGSISETYYFRYNDTIKAWVNYRVIVIDEVDDLKTDYILYTTNKIGTKCKIGESLLPENEIIDQADVGNCVYRYLDNYIEYLNYKTGRYYFRELNQNYYLYETADYTFYPDPTIEYTEKAIYKTYKYVSYNNYSTLKNELFYATYYNNAGNSTQTKYDIYYDTFGKPIYKYEYKYDTLGKKLLNNYYGYYKTGKLKSSLLTNKFYVDGYPIETNYTKYASNGKTKQIKKKSYFNQDYQTTRLDTYDYNNYGTLVSNKKYGSAYKYITYFKDYAKQGDLTISKYPISKVTRAKYSSTGKLGSAASVSATTLTKISYPWQQFKAESYNQRSINSIFSKAKDSYREKIKLSAPRK